jgi:hypothetical protein
MRYTTGSTPHWTVLQEAGLAIVIREAEGEVVGLSLKYADGHAEQENSQDLKKRGRGISFGKRMNELQGNAEEEICNRTALRGPVASSRNSSPTIADDIGRKLENRKRRGEQQGTF